MRLYYHPLSSNSRRVLLVAAHLGMNIDMVRVDLGTAEQKSPEYLRLNPNGRVPLLVDGDLNLWESCAIAQYLADVGPGEDIYPRAAAARADINRWLFWSASHFAPALAPFIRERVSKRVVAGGGAPDAGEIARAEAALPPVAALLDAHLSRSDWVAQGRLTLADFALAAPLMHMEAAQIPLGDYPALLAWFSRICATKAWVATNP